MKSFLSMIKKIGSKNLIFYGFIMIYSVFLIFLAYELNIWEDEAYSLHTTSNNLSTVISQSYNFEGQPPCYFLILAIWRHINSGIFFARLLSLIFIGFSSYFFYRIVCFILASGSSRWMLIIFLLNPFTVWAGLEIRLYSLVIFLSTILTYYFFRFYIENKNKYLYLFLFISLIGLYTQYFFIFEITALTCSLLIFKGWRIFFKFCLYLIPLGVLFLPNVFYMGQQIEMQSQKIDYSTIGRISVVWHSVQNLMLALQIVPFDLGIRIGIRISFILISMYAYFKVYKKQIIANDPYFKKINIILLSVSVIIFLYNGFVAITGIFFQDKYMAIVFPLFILVFTLFKGFSSIGRKLVYSIIAIYYILLLISNYKHPIKFYDFKSAGKFVKSIERSKEPVLFYSKSLLPPFTYYYSGSNILVPLPALKFDYTYYEENITDTVELKKAIEKINPPTKSYILITGSIKGFKYTFNMNQQMIDECLKGNYKVTLDTSFLGATINHTLRVRRLEIKDTN